MVFLCQEGTVCKGSMENGRVCEFSGVHPPAPFTMRSRPDPNPSSATSLPPSCMKDPGWG